MHIFFNLITKKFQKKHFNSQAHADPNRSMNFDFSSAVKRKVR